MKWLKLHVINNCFNDKFKTHLGLKYGDKWYCITHNSKNGHLIDKALLQMNEYSDKPEYLKKIKNSAPNIVKPINAHIELSVIEELNNK